MVTRANNIRETLEHEIISGERLPEDYLDEPQLTKRFHASRTPARCCSHPKSRRRPADQIFKDHKALRADRITDFIAAFDRRFEKRSLNWNLRESKNG